VSQIGKLYNKMKRLPTPSDILFDEIDKLLRAYGFVQREPSGGSHFVYIHSKLEGYALTIAKHGGKVKKGYVRATIQAINMIKDLNGGV
jgi:predicted RNA binding protein YcfA (HicA-like mRNA interferase family)